MTTHYRIRNFTNPPFQWGWCITRHNTTPPSARTIAGDAYHNIETLPTNWQPLPQAP